MSDQESSSASSDAREVKEEVARTGPRRVVVWACLLGIGVCCFWNVWERDFWTGGELRMAAVVREMAASGDWALPSAGGQLELSRPPLVFWLSALSARCTRGDPRWTYRVPVLAFALVSLILTYYLGKNLFSGEIAFLAVLIHGTTYAFFTRATWLGDELVFAVFCQLGMAGFVLATRPKSKRRGWVLLGWFGLAGAALAKSFFLGPLLVFGSLFLLLLVEAGPPGLMRGWRCVISLPGLLFFAILVLPWYVGAYLSQGAELLTAHLWEHLGIFVDSTRQNRPIHYQLARVLKGFSPWTVCIPLGLYHVKDRLSRTGERLCLVAILLPLILLSVLPGKEPGDTLFIWPFLSLAIAAGLWETGQRFSLWEVYVKLGSLWAARYMLLVPMALVAIIALVVGVDVAFDRSWLPALLSFGLDLIHVLPEGGEARLEAAVERRVDFVVPFGVTVAAAAAAFILSFRLRRRLTEKAYAQAAVHLAGATLCLFLAGGFFYGGINTVKSSREFVDRVKAEVKGAPLKVYGVRAAAFVYYLPTAPQYIEAVRPASGDETVIKNLREFVEGAEKVYIAASRRGYELLVRDYPSLTSKLKVVDSGYLDWSEAMVLLSNEPEEGNGAK